jgi:hypothetical protein
MVLDPLVIFPAFGPRRISPIIDHFRRKKADGPTRFDPHPPLGIIVLIILGLSLLGWTAILYPLIMFLCGSEEIVHPD